MIRMFRNHCCEVTVIAYRHRED